MFILRILLVIPVLLLSAPVVAGELITKPGADLEELIVPDGPQDLTAYRVDADVFGWNKDFTQLGCIGMELKRKPNGEQTGETFLLVFRTTSVEPIHNVHTLYITQGPTPHNPLAMFDVRDRMFGIDEVFQRMWRKRPTRKWRKGAMKVEMVWEKVMSGDRCEPAVGFILDWKGKRRFQPHEQLPDISVSCDRLRVTDNRTYWGRADVAAVMPRFELGSVREHEDSFRHPVSAVWSRARELDIRIVTNVTGPELQKAKATLARYGRVRVVPGNPVGRVLHVAPDIQVLGARLLGDLEADDAEVLDDGGGDLVYALGEARALSRTDKEQLNPRSESAKYDIPLQGRRKSR